MAEIIQYSAPGKVILCGEHSVVYQRPAIAVPISDLRAYAAVKAMPAGHGLHIHAVDLEQEVIVRDALEDNPLAKIARLVLAHLDVAEPDAMITLKSNLPIGSGMGSGASVTVALARALGVHLGTQLPTHIISAMTYEIEKIHHGTPSGIDNTVVAWEKPVYFIKGQAPIPFNIGRPFHLLIVNSGVASSTRAAVQNVRRQWTSAPQYYDTVFDCIGNIANAARTAVEQGELHTLGQLLNENHRLLQNIGVSLPALDTLVNAAQEAGALGAKLTGSGLGGNIITLVHPAQLLAIQAALYTAGATKIWHTKVG